MDSETFAPRFGWFDDGGHELAASAFPTLAQAAPGLICDAPDDGAPVLLYKAFKDVLGAYPDYPAQQIGDCVSFGHAHGLDMLQCVEIALGEPSEYRETDTEFIYGMSREVGGILGRGDGSYGAFAVKAMTEHGVVSREQLGADGAYSGRRAKSWGYYGPPAEVKEMAAKFKLGSSARVTTWAELVTALKNGYPVTISTGMGFTLRRDAQGFCVRSGRWGHCMVIGGVRFDRPGACILQSWGPEQPAGPTALDQPGYSFWADRSTVEAILAEGDSWALAKAPDFVTRELPAHWSYSVAA